MAIESSYFLVRRRKISSILEALGGRINKDHLSAIANGDGGMIIATAVYYGFTPKNEKQYYTAMHYMANVSLYMYHSMSDDNLYILITKNREQVTINIIGAVWYIATAYFGEDGIGVTDQYHGPGEECYDLRGGPEPPGDEDDGQERR